MPTSKLLPLLSLSLLGCALDSEELDLEEIEQGLTGSNLAFVTGYGEGYLSIVPPTRTGVADGMLGWIGTTTVIPFCCTVRNAAFKTSAPNSANRTGTVHLKFTGTVPATGTCTLGGGGLIVDGWTRVEGHGHILSTIDASADVAIEVRGKVNGAQKYYKSWHPAYDETKSETRTDNFDKTYYLSNGPAFYAEAGARFELDIELRAHVATSSDGKASVSLHQFGFLANTPNNIVSLDCI
jgi:hypothetical protein